jgi:general secretion pathway protein D
MLLALLLAASQPHDFRSKTVLLSFDKRELTEIVQFVSQLTGRNFILPEKVSGKLTILSNEAVPREEVWPVFLAALDANGWAVEPAGSYWKLVEKKKAFLSGDQIVTRIYRLKHGDGDQLKGVLSQFISHDAELQLLPPSTLILSDLAENVARISRLLEQLDLPAVAAEVHVVQVRFASATELAQKLTETLQQKSLRVIADERTNKLLVAGGAFDQVQQLLEQLDVPAGDGGVHVHALRNAKAEELAPTLTAIAAGMSGKKGDVKITPDKTTNTIVVIASAADDRAVGKLIDRLDQERRQVFIEAVILEVNLDDEKDLGLSAHAGQLSGDQLAVAGSELGGLSSLKGVGSLSSLGGFLAGLQGSPLTIGDTTLPAFGIVMQALQSSSDVNVISTPHLIITDNTEGEIEVGQNVPFQSGFPAVTPSATAVSSLGQLYAPIQRQNVELKLHLKAQINHDEKVRLEVDESTEEIASVDKTLGPTTSKRAAKTVITARDAETVVIGGLIQERMTKAVSKVPVLGSIPVLGWLFRNESTKKQRTNLLLFLTPYILRDTDDVRRIFERKMKERDEFVKRFFDAGDAGRSVDYEHKLGPLSKLRAGVAEELSKVENGGDGGDKETAVRASQVAAGAVECAP